MKKTLSEIKADYHKNDVCMSDLLATTPADGLTMEEAFELYIKSMQWSQGDRFFRQIIDGEREEL